MADKMSAIAYKRSIVHDAIKHVAPMCKGNFEIPMSAISYIQYGNRLRKTPVRVSYSYVSDMVYEMLKNKEI